ncbi:unnamed protein product [Clonostachys solani]|uniref:Aspartate aminotransferase n=1 Tax=Clonostachys solani TaxID=160281 RepID=A0A9N9ZF91_9HYPO|nr:unnamed protein product [Clonostachys solani]
MPTLHIDSFRELTPSWVDAIPSILADEIFSLAGECRLVESKNKVDLLIGAYRSDDGDPWPLPSVLEAERRLQHQGDAAKHEYLPIEGDPVYLRQAQKLLLGLDDQSKLFQRLVSVQTISGSGAIHIGAAFLSRLLKPGCVWVSDPTWAPHILMFERAGDVIILQVCAHNPTGLDLTQEQWKKVAEICARKGIFPFLDNAYQGFATGNPERDAWPLRYFANMANPIRFGVAQSFSKNFGLYGQRAGAFHLVLKEQDRAIQGNILQQLQFIIRTEYSAPPRTGSTIVKTILGDADLKAQWLTEVSAMSQRLGSVRSALHNGLRGSQLNSDFDHIIQQSGMFSYTGLSTKEVLRLRQEFHIYLSSSGRISMAGYYVTRAIREVQQDPSSK